MTSLKILQYNTDNLRHGWEYFENVLKNCDIAVLQRFPRNKKAALYDIMDNCRSYMVESCPPHGLCLAIARNNNSPKFGGIESVTLPSAQHVIAIGDPWQGCTALKTVIYGVNIVSFLPCYETNGNEYDISFGDTKTDIKFLLEKFKDEPTIIIGDFHVEPTVDSINSIIESNGFKSYLDKYNTFRKQGTDDFFNLDKVVSNTDIDITGVQVHDVPEGIGHMAITYNLVIK